MHGMGQGAACTACYMLRWCFLYPAMYDTASGYSLSFVPLALMPACTTLMLACSILQDACKQVATHALFPHPAGRFVQIVNIVVCRRVPGVKSCRCLAS